MINSAHSSSSDQSSTNITDLDMDAIVHCASYLNLQDISNMAMSCKYLNQVCYSDSIWRGLFRQRWPQALYKLYLKKSGVLGVRDLYVEQYISVHKFEFLDPLVIDFDMDGKPCNLIYLDKNNITFAQGPLIRMMKIDSFSSGNVSTLLNDHRARISCMRFFPINETSIFRNERQQDEDALVTSSCDHTIRLWWKGRCQRCFRGHNGPVYTLSDKLLGDGSGKVFASGGEDSTVRLWSLSSSGKRGQRALKATLYGHEKPVVLMAVAGHKTSLLASMSNDSKVRVWDTTTSSSSCCVGKTSIPGGAVALKSHESLIYLATGSSVAAVDLRTMQNVFYMQTHPQKVHSFEVLPSKSLFCTGGTDCATLWDMRRSSDSVKPKPVTVLDGLKGPITHLQMDAYKIVTASPEDNLVHVWETDTGRSTTCFDCSSLSSPYGCSAMAVNGCRIVTASSNEDHHGVLRFRDFSNSSCEILCDQSESEIVSEFWGTQSSDKSTSKFWFTGFSDEESDEFD